MKAALLAAVQGKKTTAVAVDYSPYAKYVDFKQSVWWDGTLRASLAAMTGYAFSDNVDNQPNLDANGYNVVPAELSDLELGATLVNGDFVILLVLNLTSFSNGTVPLEFNTAGAGSAANRITMNYGSGGAPTISVSVASVAQTVPAALPAMAAGRNVLMIARQNGFYSLGLKKPDGTVTVGADAASTGSVPTAVTAVDIGCSRSGGGQINGKVERFVMQNITADATARGAMLTAA